MGDYKEVDGDLIKLAQEGNFDVIAHGCNCHCTMGAGIAPQMAKAFNADTFPMEDQKHKGKINKVGVIDFCAVRLVHKKENTPSFMGRPNQLYVHSFEKAEKVLYVVNAYTQFNYGRNHSDGDQKPVDYAAIELCMKKINHLFKGKTIGLPKIGAGLAGGDWQRIKGIIQTNLKDCNVIVVNYKP